MVILLQLLLQILLLLLLNLEQQPLLVAAADLSAVQHPNFLRARADPDTTCTRAYQQGDPEACLRTRDHYGRPCQWCHSGDDVFCYNADEARWAKIFGASCETSPDDKE